MFFRIGRKREMQPTNPILVPFLNVWLRSREREWGATIENHFIGQLEPSDRILLVSKVIRPPGSTTQSHRRLPSYYRSADDMLNDLYRSYKAIKLGKRTKELVVSEEEDPRPFYRKYVESEFRRFLFGGFGQKPPKPAPYRIKFDKMLIDLYERILFPRGEKPLILGSESFMALFDFREGEFVPIQEGFARYGKILTSLLRKGRIEV